MTMIRPGRFSSIATADTHRHAFDVKNEVLLAKQTSIDYVFFGDSITEFWELEAYFNLPNQVIINRGIGGDTTEFARRRFPADVLQLNPSACIFLIGINDAWDLEYDNWLLTEGKSLDEVLAKACDNIYAMMELAHKNKLPLFICSVLPTNMNFTNHEPERKEYAVKLNQKLREMSQEFDFPYVDYFSLLVQEDQCTLQDGLANDGLHPLATGYNLMADALKTKLLEHGFFI